MGRARDITDRAHQHYLDERGRQTVTQRCGFCEWELEGTFSETRLLAAAHRTEQHPEAKQRTRFAKRRAGIKTIGTKSLGENIALNRVQGAAAWATSEDTE